MPSQWGAPRGGDWTHHTAAHQSHPSSPGGHHSACWRGCRCRWGSGTHCTSSLKRNMTVGEWPKERSRCPPRSVLGGRTREGGPFTTASTQQTCPTGPSSAACRNAICLHRGERICVHGSLPQRHRERLKITCMSNSGGSCHKLLHTGCYTVTETEETL